MIRRLLQRLTCWWERYYCWGSERGLDSREWDRQCGPLDTDPDIAALNQRIKHAERLRGVLRSEHDAERRLS